MYAFVRRLVPSLLLVLTPPAAAQKLPTGELHRDRERAFDLRHVRAELTIDPAAKSVAGTATLTLAPLRTLGEVTLDAVALAVEGVSLVTEGEAGASLEHASTGRTLTIDLGREVPAGEELTLAVRYRATPRAGMYFQRDWHDPERYWITTYGEGGLHANWLPIYADVNDKLTSDMVIKVPSSYVAIANGALADERTDGGWTTYDWRQALPHPNYLIALYVGDYERGELEPAFGEIPLAYWVPRGRLAEGAFAFRNTRQMVEFFSRRFDYRYPWVKYDQIAMPDYPVGAMEHTGVTGHNSSVLRGPEEEAPLDFGGPTFSEYYSDWSAEATIAHELAHHWFGDNLTCRNLSYIWLNESFASYLMMLWDEESVGRDQLLFDLDLARRHYFAYVADEHVIRPLEYPRFDAPQDIYNLEHTYLKGAAVLHMLRAVLGDEPYFRALGHYLDRHEFGNVVSQDLKIAIEESVGVNLDWFFDQWVTGGGHPRFEVSYRYHPERGLLDLSIAQVQPLVEGQGIFRLPVTIAVATAGDTIHQRIWIDGEEEQVLIPVAEKPLMVSFDGAGDLVAEIDFAKDPDELLYQSRHDALPGRLRALRQLAARYPTRTETLEALKDALAPESFWALQAEAAERLGDVRTSAAEDLLERAFESADYRVRKAAVLALAHFGTTSAVDRLREIIRSDPHGDVVGTAIVALADADPDVEPAFFEQQLSRDAWWDEIRIATLEALKELEKPELAAVVAPYTGPEHNQDVRQAALNAWEAADPADEKLHAVLRQTAQGPPYPLQKAAIEMLGRLAVSDAVPELEALVNSQADPNLTKLANEALAEIRRVDGGEDR